MSSKGYRIGDHVETITGKVGVIRYIGKVDFMYDKKKIVVGIDLIDKPGTTNGKENNKRYFNVCNLYTL